MSQKQDIKHPSLELLKDISPSRPTLPEQEPEIQRILSLQKQHETNIAEKQRLTELKTLLETDEADLTELRRQVLEKIHARLLK